MNTNIVQSPKHRYVWFYQSCSASSRQRHEQYHAAAVVYSTIERHRTKVRASYWSLLNHAVSDRAVVGIIKGRCTPRILHSSKLINFQKGQASSPRLRQIVWMHPYRGERRWNASPRRCQSPRPVDRYVHHTDQIRSDLSFHDLGTMYFGADMLVPDLYYLHDLL